MTRKPYHRPLEDENFIELYSSIVNDEKPAGNGIVGESSDPSNLKTSLFYCKRGFYTEAKPSDKVTIIMGMNPGTPLAEDAELKDTSGVDRLAACLDIFHNNLNYSRKAFFTKLKRIMGMIAHADESTVFRHFVFTNLVKQSTRQKGQNFEKPDKALVDEGRDILRRELNLWNPIGIIALGNNVRESLGGTKTLYGYKVEYIYHPSAPISLEHRKKEAKQIRRRFGNVT